MTRAQRTRQSIVRFRAGWALILALPLLSGCQRSEVGVLAHVDGNAITARDFRAAAQDHPYLGANPDPEAKRELLDELLDRALLVEEARRLGMDDTDRYHAVMADVRRQLLYDELYRSLVSDPVAVSEAEVRRLWEMRRQEWRISQIFLFDERQVERAVSRLEAGESFAEVARTGSMEAGSAQQGGDIGWVKAGELSAGSERELLSLSVGEWTGPIASNTGYYLVQLTDRRAREPEPLHEIQFELSEMLRIRKERALVLSFISDLKARHRIRQIDSSFEILAENWQNRAPQELMESGGDLKALGFTDEQLTLPLVTYDGGEFTIGDLFRELYETPTLDRPPGTSDPLLRLYIEDRVVERLLLERAEKGGFDQYWTYHEQFRDREESFLVDRLYEQHIVTSSAVTAEEKEALWEDSRSDALTEEEVERIYRDREARLFEEKRQDTLRELLERLRRENPPVVDEEAFSRVPWPLQT